MDDKQKGFGMIKTLLQESHTEAAHILHNARAAHLAGEISMDEFNEIRQAVFDCLSDNVNAALLFGENVAVFYS